MGTARPSRHTSWPAMRNTSHVAPSEVSSKAGKWRRSAPVGGRCPVLLSQQPSSVVNSGCRARACVAFRFVLLSRLLIDERYLHMQAAWCTAPKHCVACVCTSCRRHCGHLSGVLCVLGLLAATFRSRKILQLEATQAPVSARDVSTHRFFLPRARAGKR